MPDPLPAREPGLQPLAHGADGVTLAFTVVGKMYQPMAALGILAGLHGREFTGVCECYLRPGVDGDQYMMGGGVELADGPPDDDWWAAFVTNVEYAIAEDEHARLNRDGCEFASLGELRAGMVHAGTAGFDGGAAVWVSDPDHPDPDSPFTVLCRSAR
jgi:hypothetical protein